MLKQQQQYSCMKSSYLGQNNNNKNVMIIQQLPLGNKCRMVGCDEIIKTQLCALNQIHFLIPLLMEYLKQFATICIKLNGPIALRMILVITLFANENEE